MYFFQVSKNWCACYPFEQPLWDHIQPASNGDYYVGLSSCTPIPSTTTKSALISSTSSSASTSSIQIPSTTAMSSSTLPLTTISSTLLSSSSSLLSTQSTSTQVVPSGCGVRILLPTEGAMIVATGIPSQSRGNEFAFCANYCYQGLNQRENPWLSMGLQDGYCWCFGSTVANLPGQNRPFDSRMGTDWDMSCSEVQQVLGSNIAASTSSSTMTIFLDMGTATTQLSAAVSKLPSTSIFESMTPSSSSVARVLTTPLYSSTVPAMTSPSSTSLATKTSTVLTTTSIVHSTTEAQPSPTKSEPICSRTGNLLASSNTKTLVSAGDPNGSNQFYCFDFCEGKASAACALLGNTYQTCTCYSSKIQSLSLSSGSEAVYFGISPASGCSQFA